jgi:hypothetical protein
MTTTRATASLISTDWAVADEAAKAEINRPAAASAMGFMFGVLSMMGK